MARTFDQLYALTLPEIQEVFLEVMGDVVSRAMLDEMVKAIEAGDAEALFQASGFTPAVLGPLIDRIEASYELAGREHVDSWPVRIRTPFGLVQPMFNMRNPAVEQDLKQYSSTLIAQITEEARSVVREKLQMGLIAGENPRTTALDIVGRINPSTRKREGGIIGLTANQARWSANAKKYLETLDEKYLSMGLRDKRFDRTVLKAIQSGKPLPSDTVSKLITAYNSNVLRYRGEMVARTETLQSLNKGFAAGITQAIDEGNITREQVKKWWANSHDGRVRGSHVVAGITYSKDKAIDLEQPFVMVSGARLQHPGDTSLGAPGSEIIMCRCAVRYKIDFFAEEV